MKRLTINNMNNYADWKFNQVFSKLRKHHEMMLKQYEDFFDFAENLHLIPNITLNWLEDKQEESETANTQVKVNDDFSDSDKQLVEARAKCKEAIEKMNNSQRETHEAIIKENFITKLSEGRGDDIKNNCFDSSCKKDGLSEFNCINVSSFLNNAHNTYNGEVTEVGEPCSRDEVDCFAFMDEALKKTIDPSYKTWEEKQKEKRKAVEAEQQKKVNERLNVSIITRKAVINNAVTKVSRALRNMIRSEEWKNRYKDETKENKRAAIPALLIKSIFCLFDKCSKYGIIFKDDDIVDKDLIRLTNDITLNDEVAKALYDIKVILGQVRHVLTSKNHLTQTSYVKELDGLNIDNVTKLSYTFIVGNNSFELSFNSEYPKKTCDIEIKAVDNNLPIIINSNTGFDDLFRYILENSKFRTNIIN